MFEQYEQKPPTGENLSYSCSFAINYLFLQFHVELEVDVKRLRLRREVQLLVVFQHVDGISRVNDGPRVVPQDVHVVHRCPRCLAKGLMPVLVIDDHPLFLHLHFVFFLDFLLCPEDQR